MNDDPRGAPQRAEEANRLYWHTDMGVNQIAEEMSLSKGALYALVEPLDAELPCPRCDGGLVYPNRTARDRGFLSCPSCGLEEEVSALEGVETPGRQSRRPGRGSGAERAGDEGDTGEGVSRAMSAESTRLLVGAGLLVVAAGLVVTRVLRRD